MLEEVSGLDRDLKRQSKELSEIKKKSIAQFEVLAQSYREVEKLRKAEKVYRLIVQYDPEAGSAYQALGEIYLKLGKGYLSEKMFKKASFYLKERK